MHYVQLKKLKLHTYKIPGEIKFYEHSFLDRYYYYYLGIQLDIYQSDKI